MAELDIAELLGGDDVDLEKLLGEAVSDTDDDDAGVADDGETEDQPGEDDEPAAKPARDEKGRFAKADEAESEDGEESPEDVDADAEGDDEGEPGPDAEAEAAFERRYQERFAEESRQAVQEAVSKLQSSLDRRYAQLDHAKRDVEAELAVHRDVVSRALGALAEYDEDAAKALQQHAGVLVSQARTARQSQRVQQDSAAQAREAWYAQYNATAGNPYVDPNDPDLLEAFRTGNRPAYDSRFRLLQMQSAQAAAAKRERPKPQPTPSKAAEKIKATKEREAKRGKQPLAEGKAPSRKLDTFDDADKLVQHLAKQLNISF